MQNNHPNHNNSALHKLQACTVNSLFTLQIERGHEETQNLYKHVVRIVSLIISNLYSKLSVKTNSCFDE